VAAFFANHALRNPDHPDLSVLVALLGCFLHSLRRLRLVALFFTLAFHGIIVEVLQCPADRVASIARAALWPVVLYVALRTVDAAGLSYPSAPFTAGLLSVIYAAPCELLLTKGMQWILPWLIGGVAAGAALKAGRRVFGDSGVSQILFLPLLPCATQAAIILNDTAAHIGLGRVAGPSLFLFCVGPALMSGTVIGTRLPVDLLLLLAPTAIYCCCLGHALQRVHQETNLEMTHTALTQNELCTCGIAAAMSVLLFQWRMLTLGSLRWAKRDADVLEHLELRAREKRQLRQKAA